MPEIIPNSDPNSRENGGTNKRNKLFASAAHAVRNAFLRGKRQEGPDAEATTTYNR